VSQGVEKLYREVELPLVRVLARMEHVGVGADLEQLRAINIHLKNEVKRLTAELYQIAGTSFNLNSPKQLSEILYTGKGLTPPRKTKTGYSTDATTLETLRAQWPEFIEPLLRYREFEKLRSTYGEGLIQAVSSDGRIHATFNQTVARTGRLSSDQPNLHNIPVRSEEGRVFRKAFVPSAGHVLLVADYNQIELRCIAHLANDPGLIDAFINGVDIHTATAASVFGVQPNDVTYEQRSQAKMVSYGLAYGMEAYGLSQRLGIGVTEASAILDAYFLAFPNVKKYMDATVAEARKRGYTETMFGRRRPIPELQSANFRIRQSGERQAMNAGIQGLAADIFKIALVRIDRELEAAQLSSRLILQVHDEVLVETLINEKSAVEKLVLDAMKSAATLVVPLEVNAAWGDSWASAKA
ncbi:MAG: DNA polymerase, partial [Ilumatobacteraceae bacterium]